MSGYNYNQKETYFDELRKKYNNFNVDNNVNNSEICKWNINDYTINTFASLAFASYGETENQVLSYLKDSFPKKEYSVLKKCFNYEKNIVQVHLVNEKEFKNFNVRKNSNNIDISFSYYDIDFYFKIENDKIQVIFNNINTVLNFSNGNKIVEINFDEHFTTVKTKVSDKTINDDYFEYNNLFINMDKLQNNFNFEIMENSIENETKVKYIDFYDEKNDYIIVAIKGSDNFEDWVQNAYIWGSSVLLESSSYFGTFIKLWPRFRIANLINIIDKEYNINKNLLYYKDVKNHIEDLQKSKKSKIILTGHSLGGGIAGILSAKLNLTAITFSSPGLGYSFESHHFSLINLLNSYVNVIPLNDIIPYIDSQIGQLFYINCYHEDFSVCHSISNTVLYLSKFCGIEINNSQLVFDELKKLFKNN